MAGLPMVSTNISTGVPGVGKRVSLYRRARGFMTAAPLAATFENPPLTTAVVQNVEVGERAI